MIEAVPQFCNGGSLQCFTWSWISALHELLCLGCNVFIYTHLQMISCCCLKCWFGFGAVYALVHRRLANLLT